MYSMDCSSFSLWRGCIRRLYFVLRPVCEQMTAVSWVGSLKQYTRQRLSFILDGYIGYIGYIGYNYTDITAGMLRAGGQCPARPGQTESAWRRCCSTGPGGEGSCNNYVIIMIFTSLPYNILVLVHPFSVTTKPREALWEIPFGFTRKTIWFHAKNKVKFYRHYPTPNDLFIPKPPTPKPLLDNPWKYSPFMYIGHKIRDY